MNKSNWLFAVVLVLSAGLRAPEARADGPWNGHDFVFVFATDDGNKCNLAWADTARAKDFRFTISANVRSTPLGSTKLTWQELHNLQVEGFEVAMHGATHAVQGLPVTCPSPPRGSWMGYFLCSEVPEYDRMVSLHREIERDTMAVTLNIPVSAVRTACYPAHRHSKALIDTLRAEGYIGARTGGLWDYSSNSYGDFNFKAYNSWSGGISMYRLPLANADTWVFGNHSANPPVHRTHADFLTVAQPIMNEFKASHGICVMYTHHLGDDDDSYGNVNYGTGGITPLELSWFVDLVRANNGTIMTLGEAMAYYRARGHETVVNGDYVWMPGTPSGVGETPSASLADLNVFPNPFNPRTTIAFDLALGGTVRVAIHDVRGRLVRTLQDGTAEAGRHELDWHGEDDNGRTMPAGTYLLKVDTAQGTETRSVSLIK